MSRQTELEELLKPAVEAAGFEFWGMEYHSQGRHSVLRIFIDSEDGIDVEDCAKVSHQVSGVLDVEDPISGEFNLEVSSPGLDRPLFTSEQFAQYIGQQVNVRLRVSVDNRRKFKGVIENVEGERIHLQVEGTGMVIGPDQIEKANLVPEFD